MCLLVVVGGWNAAVDRCDASRRSTFSHTETAAAAEATAAATTGHVAHRPVIITNINIISG